MRHQDNLAVMDAQALTKSWGWVLAFGILFLIMGTIGLGMSISLTLASMFLFGVLLLIGSGVHIYDVFKSRKLKGAFWHILLTLLYLMAALTILNEPFFASSLLTLIIAAILLTMGLVRVIWGFFIREIAGSGWIIVSGIASFILGFLVMAQWPSSGLWFLGLMIAIEMIVTGWTYIFMAIALRRA